MLDDILKILPENLAREIKNVGTKSGITEIRLRVQKRAVIITQNIELELGYSITVKDLLDILVRVSSNSIYAIQNDINNGFIIIKGGHRIGICGEAVLQDFKIKNIKYINSMNIRVAKQIIGCADKLMSYIIVDKRVENTLIVSPPRLWKNYYTSRYNKANK